jgi:hypothetical protein
LYSIFDGSSGRLKTQTIGSFKGKSDGTLSKHLGHLDNRNVYSIQEKGYCDSNVMLLWINECLKPFHDGQSPALLMMDNFSAHLTSNIRKELAAAGWLHCQYD